MARSPAGDRLHQRPGPPPRGGDPEEGGCATAWVEQLAIVDEALGRSRGGLTSKIHLATDGRGLPMSVILTPGQAGDNPQLLPLLDQASVKRDGPGRPRKRPDRLRRGTRGGRPPAFDAETSKGRNVVERCFNRLKQFRAPATRYTKRAAYYRSELTIAAIMLWLRDSPDTAYRGREQKRSSRGWGEP